MEGPLKEHGCILRASCSALFLEHVTVCQLSFSVIIGNNKFHLIATKHFYFIQNILTYNSSVLSLQLPCEIGRKDIGVKKYQT